MLLSKETLEQAEDSELQELRFEIEVEIEVRRDLSEESQRENLRNMYKQLQYLKSFDNVEIKTSTFQALKILGNIGMSAAIGKAKTGIKIVIS